MSTYAKSNREHSFDTELAAIVGLEKAILLKNVSYWCEENERRNNSDFFQYGAWWTEESLNSLVAKYPYLKRPSISRWMSELRDSHWIRVMSILGGKNLYARGPVFLLWNTGGDWRTYINTLSQNETLQGVSQNETQGVSQNETGGVSKWNTGVSQNETHNIDYIDSIDVDLILSETRAQEKPGSMPKKTKKSPPVPAAPPVSVQEIPLLFAQSAFAAMLPADWSTALLAACVDLQIPNIDTAWYYGRVRDWSATKGARSADWLATARTFILSDQKKNALVTIQPALSNDNPLYSATNSGNNSGANNSAADRAAADRAATIATAARVAARRRQQRSQFS